jgi:hypothetical protein
MRDKEQTSGGFSEMEQDNNRKFPPELRFFIEATRAIYKQRYRDGLEVLKNGLDKIAENDEAGDSKHLIACLVHLVDELNSTLKKAYGEAWEDRAEIPIFQETEDEVRCSFCTKKPDEVENLIAGGGVYICNECILDISQHMGYTLR